jgi:hypothetical protein
VAATTTIKPVPVAERLPEPEVVTDEELLRTYGKAKREHCYDGPIDDWPRREERAATVHGLRAVIAADRAHFARPAIEPVPVAERLPGPEDCDEEGRCFLFSQSVIPDLQTWILAPAAWAAKFPHIYTHSLPHHALPVPTTH